jgi:hypothetical protein
VFASAAAAVLASTGGAAGGPRKRCVPSPLAETLGLSTYFEYASVVQPSRALDPGHFAAARDERV